MCLFNVYSLCSRASRPNANKGIHVTCIIRFLFTAIKETEVYVQGPTGGVNFIADDLSIRQMAKDPNWRHESDANINRYRKSNIVIT